METLSEDALLQWLDQSRPSPEEHRLRRETGGDWRWLWDAVSYFQCSNEQLLTVAKKLKGGGYIGCMAGSEVELSHPVEILSNGRARLLKMATLKRRLEVDADRRRDVRRKKKIEAQKMYYKKTPLIESRLLPLPKAKSKTAQVESFEDREWWEPGLPDALVRLASNLENHGGKAESAALSRELNRHPSDILIKHNKKWNRWIKTFIKKPSRGVYQLRVKTSL